MATMHQPAPVHPGNAYQNAASKREAEQQRAHRERRKQALRLQMENILSQRTSNPARRAALESALAQVEAQLAELG